MEPQPVGVVLEAAVHDHLRDVGLRRDAVQGEPGDPHVHAIVVAVAAHEHDGPVEPGGQLREAVDELRVRGERGAVGAIPSPAAIPESQTWLPWRRALPIKFARHRRIAFGRMGITNSGGAARVSGVPSRRIAAGPYPGSVFYASTGTFALTHTCNTWTAQALQVGGLPVAASGVALADEIGAGGAAALKSLVVDSISAFLAPIRERRASYAVADAGRVLERGARRARALADETLAQVRQAMGMVYG